MAHHRFQQRTTTSDQERQRERAFVASSRMWDFDWESRQLQGVKRRRYIKRFNAFMKRLQDPNDPFGKPTCPSLALEEVDWATIKKMRAKP